MNERIKLNADDFLDTDKVIEFLIQEFGSCYEHYISTTLAGDFACQVAIHLHKTVEK